MAYEKLICATDNDAYNTLVATDLAPEFGRDNVFQVKRLREASSRHALPATLGGRVIAGGKTYFEANALISQGWEFRVTGLSEEFTLDQWREKHPEAIMIAELGKSGTLRFLEPEAEPKNTVDVEILSLMPVKPKRRES